MGSNYSEFFEQKNYDSTTEVQLSQIDVDAIVFYDASGNEIFKIDRSNGNVTIKDTSDNTVCTINNNGVEFFENATVTKIDTSSAKIIKCISDNTSHHPNLKFQKAENDGSDAPADVTTNDILSNITFNGFSNGDFNNAGQIYCIVTGAPTGSYIPTSIIIRTGKGSSPGYADAITIDSAQKVKLHGNVGFNNTSPIAKPTVTGSRGSNAALASLLTALANYGLITDSTS
jgi:hypothetical protein